MKTCARCRETKPLGEFQRRSSRPGGRGSYCVLCARAMGQEKDRRIQADPVRKAARDAYQKAHHRKTALSVYGLTVEEYQALAEAQDHRCAICNEEGLALRELVSVADRKHVLAVDHCHEGGQVRGLLCTRCNSLLGMARDSEEILMAAVRYLQRSRVKAA